VIERGVALRILGLPEDADEIEIGSAYRAMRSHVEGRLAAAASDAEREARRSELRDLERALRSLSTVPLSGGFVERPAGRSDGAGPPRRVARWVLLWAVLATLTAAGLVAYLFAIPGSFGPAVLVGGGGGSGSGGGGGFALEGEGGADDGLLGDSGPSGDVQSAGARARVVAKSSVEGAELRVIQKDADGQPQVVAEGAADDTVYWVSPGDYALEVRHPDCPDVWERDLSAGAGETHEFAPEVCRETGWVVVQSDQADDQVSIDGKEIGASTEERHALSAGEHQVRVEKDGYETWEGVVAVAPGQVLGLRPQLTAATQKRPRKQKRQQAAVAAPQPQRQAENEADLRELQGWHEKAKQWLLARYDEDRSGRLDSESEIAEVPCDQWLGLEQSHDASGLGLSLTRFYGFDGDGWKDDSLGVDSRFRDVAYERMKECGLR